MYTIAVRTRAEAEHFVTGLRACLDYSRFRVRGIDIKVVQRRDYRFDVELKEIRLRENKPYCGSHPGPCLRGGFRRHASYTFLEGCDWVAFNDMVNEILDKLNMSANVASARCKIRKGTRRRINYDMRRFSPSHYDWVHTGTDDDYRDCRLQEAPESSYPDGTPGDEGWLREGETEFTFPLKALQEV